MLTSSDAAGKLISGNTSSNHRYEIISECNLLNRPKSFPRWSWEGKPSGCGASAPVLSPRPAAPAPRVRRAPARSTLLCSNVHTVVTSALLASGAGVEGAVAVAAPGLVFSCPHRYGGKPIACSSFIPVFRTCPIIQWRDFSLFCWNKKWAYPINSKSQVCNNNIATSCKLLSCLLRAVFNYAPLVSCW